MGISTYTINSVVIDGVSGIDHDFNVNAKRVTGQVSPPLTSGQKFCVISTGAPSFLVSNTRVEILEKSSTPTPPRRVFLIT